MTVQQPGTGAAALGADVQARLMLVLLCFIWGFSWPLMKVALYEIPPLSMRASTSFIGALTLLLVCLLKRRSLRVGSAKAWTHVIVAAMLNVVGFSLFSAFGQMAAATTRVAILTYTMPIWALVLAWAVLGERPTRMQVLAIALCAVGLAVLVAPLASAGIPLGLLLAVGSGFSWAAGTVYLKWARIQGDPIAIATWQLLIAFFVIGASMLIFEGGLQLGNAHAAALLSVVFTGLAANALAFALWFEIVGRVPALTATLGIVGIPVIGVLATIVILGERLTLGDTLGFAFIFGASVCAQIPASVFRKASG